MGNFFIIGVTDVEIVWVVGVIRKPAWLRGLNITRNQCRPPFRILCLLAMLVYIAAWPAFIVYYIALKNPLQGVVIRIY